MQLSTLDTNISIIFNNPSKDINILFFLYDELKNLQTKKKLSIKPYCTKVTNFKNQNIYYLEIKSNIMMCRPLIRKNYKTYFDIFHC